MKRFYLCALAALVVALAPNTAFTTTINVLWDTSHSTPNFFDYYTQYEDIIDYLGTQDFAVTRNTGDLLSTNLANYDTIVVSILTSQDGTYTSAEADKISNFVIDGGGLLVMGDNSSSSNANIAAVASKFGVGLGVSNPDSSSLSFGSNAILNAISTLHFQGAGELLVSSPSSTIVWAEDGGSKPLVATASYGLGRVVILGDADMMTNSYYNKAGTDNRDFALHTFEYMNGMVVTPEPATIVMLGLGGIGLMRRKRS